MNTPRALYLLALLAAVPVSDAVGQIRPFHAVVATRNVGPVATRLFEADLVTGLLRPISRFPSDVLPALAVRIDPADDSLIVAFEHGNATRFVRLALEGSTVVRESFVALVGSAIVTDFVLQGDILATCGGAGGGLLRVPMDGGPLTFLTSLPGAVALDSTYDGSVEILQAGSVGPPFVEPRVVRVDVSTGQVAEAIVLSGLTPGTVTGLQCMPTALVRQLVSIDDGRVAEVLFHTDFIIHPAQPGFPPGTVGPIESGSFGIETVGLGDAAHPFVMTLEFFGAPGLAWRRAAGPLPGTPVDVNVATYASGTASTFGLGCGKALPLRIGTSGGRPWPSNSDFGIELLHGAGLSPALLVLGLSDLSSGGIPLPYTLPNFCQLLVSPDFVAPVMTDPVGRATVPLPIPDDHTLRGAVLYAQWLQFLGLPFATSDGLDFQIGT